MSLLVGKVKMVGCEYADWRQGDNVKEFDNGIVRPRIVI